MLNNSFKYRVNDIVYFKKNNRNNTIRRGVIEKRTLTEERKMTSILYYILEFDSSVTFIVNESLIVKI